MRKVLLRIVLNRSRKSDQDEDEGEDLYEKHEDQQPNNFVEHCASVLSPPTSPIAQLPSLISNRNDPFVLARLQNSLLHLCGFPSSNSNPESSKVGERG